jgi:hypothetical protein
MTNLRKLFDEATASAPPSRLSIEDVFAATRSSWRRRLTRVVGAVVATLATAAAGGIALTSEFATHLLPDPAPPSGAVIAWAGRGDKSHLYLVIGICRNTPPTTGPDQTCVELLASSDGGATWSNRGSVHGWPQIVGPATVIRPGDGRISPRPTDPSSFDEVSINAGETWSQLRAEGSPTDGVMPPGRASDRYARTGYELIFFDQAQSRWRKLARQPSLLRRDSQTFSRDSTLIMASGVNPVTFRTAVAVSRDGGRTWTEQDMPGAPVTPQPTMPNGEIDRIQGGGGQGHLITRDGVTAYVTVWDGSKNPSASPPPPGAQGPALLRTYRTTDSGQTWQAVAAWSTTPQYARMPGNARAWVTTDGHLVTGLLGDSRGEAKPDSYSITTDGVTHTPITLPGLPRSVKFIDGELAYDDNALYLSDDGVNWRQVWHN